MNTLYDIILKWVRVLTNESSNTDLEQQDYNSTVKTKSDGVFKSK